MARRRNNDDEGMNLDSLMDALTNVVAVLILVLVLVQADVSKKVADFMEELEPATPEQVEQSQVALDKTQQEIDELKNLLEQEAPTPEQVNKAKTELVILEKDIKENSEMLVNIENLKKLEEKSRKEQEAEEKKTVALQERIAELEAQLDVTPELEAPPATVVTIPNSRPIPENSRVYTVIVNDDRVHFIDPFTPVEVYEDVMRKNKSKWNHERIKKPGADLYVYDQKKIVQYFNENALTNSRSQKITVPPRPTGTWLYIRIEPDLKEGGTTLDQLAQTKNTFDSIMRKLASDRKAVIMFRVNPNGFPTYLAARAVVDKYRIPAGWEVNAWSAYHINMTDVKVQQLEQPDPNQPKPPAKPKPPAIDPSLD